MEQKYEILREQYIDIGGRPGDEGHHRLFRIRALRDIPVRQTFFPDVQYDIKAGDFGGWVEDETCLEQTGNCWIDKLAMVFDGASVSGDAFVGGTASAYEGSVVKNSAGLFKNCTVSGGAEISGFARIYDFVSVNGGAIKGHAIIGGDVKVECHSEISGTVKINGWTDKMRPRTIIINNSKVSGNADISGEVTLIGADISGNVTVKGENAYIGNVALSGRENFVGDAMICGNGDYFLVGPFAKGEFYTAFRTRGFGGLKFATPFGTPMSLNELRETGIISRKIYKALWTLLGYRMECANLVEVVKGVSDKDYQEAFGYKVPEKKVEVVEEKTSDD